MMPPLEGLSVFELLYPVLSSNNLLLASPDAGYYSEQCQMD